MPRNEECKLCGLHKNARNVCVWGEGPQRARVMLIGLGPGPTEDKYGRPFIGPSKEPLERILNLINLPRQEVYISNIIKCRPPGNKPKSSEIKACLPYLFEEIRLVQPDVLMCLGEVACRAIIGKGKPTKLAGKVFNVRVLPDTFIDESHTGTFPVIAGIHPAALIRRGDREAGSDSLITKQYVKAFQTLKRFLDGTLQDEKDYGTYNISPGPKEVLQTLEAVRAQKFYTLDLETSGLDPFSNTAAIKCASITVKPKQALVIPWGRKYWGDVWPTIKKALSDLLKDREVTCNGHNLKYEYKWLFKHLLDNKIPNNEFSDTIIMHYLLADYEPHSLSDLAWKYSKMGGYDQEAEKVGIENMEGETAYFKCACDTDLTHRFASIFTDKMIDDGVYDVYHNLLVPSAKTLLEMEIKGVPVDQEHLKHLFDRAEDHKKELREEIVTLPIMSKFLKQYEELIPTPDDFNPRSPDHMRTLAKFLDIKVFKQTKETKKPSVDKEVLEYYAPQYPVLDRILRTKEMLSLQSYITKQYIPNISDDGRIHTNYNLWVARSGRLSSSGPNLQNIFKDLARKYPDLNVRNFIVADPGYKILKADFNQHELRVLAAVSGDPVMRSVLNSGRDLHSKTGSEILKAPFDDFEQMYNDKNPKAVKARRRGKDTNFGVVYGIGPQKLSRQLRVTLKEAKEYLEAHRTAYPHFYIWKTQQERFLETHKYVQLVTGRKRRFPVITDDAKRGGVNALVQGPASDLMLMAMNRINAFLKKNKMRSWLMLTVHDEVDIMAADDEVDELPGLIELLMTNPDVDWLGDIRLKVDFSVGERWGELKEIKAK